MRKLSCINLLAASARARSNNAKGRNLHHFPLMQREINGHYCLSSGVVTNKVKQVLPHGQTAKATYILSSVKTYRFIGPDFKTSPKNINTR